MQVFQNEQDYHVGAGFPAKNGLYDPSLEKDSCGVGFVADMNRIPTRKTVLDALELLRRLTHRGACGCDENSGDGAGILCSIPHAFLKSASASNWNLPDAGEYAVGNIFLPMNQEYRKVCQDKITEVVRQNNLEVLGWRKVKTNNTELGAMPRSTEPCIMQLFIVKPLLMSSEQFEMSLYLSRKTITNSFGKARPVYICSLSSKIIVYKGYLTPAQLPVYFVDLAQEEFTASLAMVHSRFSTNTFPSWERAQPFRNLSHNGEINTLRGNVNWTSAREGIMNSSKYGDTLKQLFPIIEFGGSDSAMFDNVLEFLSHTGKSIIESMMIMIPEAWQNDANMPNSKKEFYEFFSSLIEPWDGPALVSFTDGDCIGAVLDRNGLRPGRFYVTVDGRVICASEVGVIDIPDDQVVQKGRLRPGHMFLVDMKAGKILNDDQVKQDIVSRRPYGDWLSTGKISLDALVHARDTSQAEISAVKFPRDDTMNQLKLFGYTVETLEMLIGPMATTGYEALGSMGNDLPLAVLSSRPRNIFDYFRQLFAQVTNPPIDPIRERIVTSLQTPVGPEGNLLEINELCCNRIFTSNPVLTPAEFDAITNVPGTSWKPAVVDITFAKSDGVNGLLDGLTRICKDVQRAVDEGSKLIVLSDVSAGAGRVPIMSAMATGTVHHFLVHSHLRSKVGVIVQTGDAREIHHFCVLLGFGADLVYPYLAYQAIYLMQCDGKMKEGLSTHHMITDYQKATTSGITKVMSKMGVSTLQSYKGAQIFEALGIHQEVIDLCFTGCASRIGGADFEAFSVDSLKLHDFAFPSRSSSRAPKSLISDGYYHWRQGKDAELHLNDPQAIAHLQNACRTNDVLAFRKYTEITNRIVKSSTIRGLFALRYGVREPIDISEVEPAKEIVKRFCTGAMSLGSISRETHTTVALAMNRIGGKSNSGEGGEEIDRYTPLLNGDSMCSSIKQVASARFGVSIYYLTNCIEIQIKMAQGAKPGEGGELPGYKVQGAIATTRKSTPGVGLISPPPHHDIYSIEDLAQLIFDLKNSNPAARISVKLVSEVGVGVVAAGVTKGMADHILISGHDGGTGASRWTSIKYAGLPWELGLAEAHQTLVQNGLRERVVLQVDGQMKTGLDVVKAALLGAEEFGFGTTALITLGCIMMRKCHLNTCPVGIATQDPILRKKFEGAPEHLINFMFMVAQDTREILSQLGYKKLDDIIGRADLIEQDEHILSNPKLKGLDLSAILKPAFKMGTPQCAVRFTTKQDHKLDNVLDASLVKKLLPSIKKKEKVSLELSIRNTDRCVGGLLSHTITKIHGIDALPAETLKLKFKGSAGQSFGAWLAKGVQFELEGDANDYVGKGLSGGRIIVYPPYNAQFKAEDNIICGNVLLYGATEGEAFFNGIVAERFAVRNSGAVAVVEGVGDHGCEYMTNGRVLVLGSTGRNFAAGMSGGIAYVFDEFGHFESLCNTELVDLDPLEDDDILFVKDLIQRHHLYTKSTKALLLLSNWESSVKKFIKVFPRDYKTALLHLKKENVSSQSKVDAERSGEDRKAQIADIEDMALNNSDNRPITVSSPSKKKGFIDYARGAALYRNADDRVKDFDEIYTQHDKPKLKTQAARCMDCGIPFCHQEGTGCPLGNRIPEWNTLVFEGRWREALDRLLATNNFPEFTGKVCPAPCEGACVLGIIEKPVTIKNIEMSIIDHAFENGWMNPSPPEERTGKVVYIIGSGPAGLAAADQLNKAGHSVTVFERSDRIGGLLMYGVPNMKLDKEKVVQRRVNLMAAEGVTFITNHQVGVDSSASLLRKQCDAMVLATGSTIPRNLPVKGRQLKGIHFAMEFLHQNTKSLLDSQFEDQKFINAKGKKVIVIGGGDTGNDCIGTAMRHECKSVVNFELLPQSPENRAIDNPWPQWPKIFRVDYGHEEVKKSHGDDPRQYCVLSKEFIGDANGNVTGIATVRIRWERDAEGRWVFKELEGTEKVFCCDLVFLAMGFIGPEKKATEDLGVEYDMRGNFKAAYQKYTTNVEGVFAAGDCRRGQSLVVWGIAEGRQAAREVDAFLMGSSMLP